MDLTDFITGMLVLITGGVLGGIGTYFIKPPLDAWMERRKEARKTREAALKQQQEAAKQLALADQAASAYREKLVRELRNLRILDMVRPLDLEQTYVRLSVQEEQPRRYADAEEMATLARGDPNLLFELSRDQLNEDKAESFSPENALHRYRHLVVLGDPGAGKTTMLKYICLQAAQGKISGLPDLPVFITLNRYAKKGQTGLLDFIVAEVAERYGFQQSRRYLEDRLEDGSILLLLDGLDEVTVGTLEEAETAYRQTVSEINLLSTRYPKCPIVVTSRRAGWKGQLAPTFMLMAVLDFTWEDIQHFISNWFDERPDSARALQVKLSQQIRMQALAANPLLLSLIAIVFERDLDLPERRAKLYERCVHVLLTEWDSHRSIKRAGHFTADRKRDLLEDIALHFHTQRSRYFPKDELLDVIASFLPTVNIPAEQAELVLEEISAQHGLLKEQAADWYGFLHLTLQEYFTAVHLDKSGHIDLALTNRYNPWWEEVLLLLAGMIKDATPLLKAILSDQEDIFYSNLILAGRCLAGTPRIRQIGLREQIIDRLKSLIEDEQEHSFPRTQAVRSLREAEGEKSSTYLISLVRNESLRPQVRTAAVDALRGTSDKTVIMNLLDIVADETLDSAVREWVGSQLINFCDKSWTLELLTLVSNQELHHRVRDELTRTLGLVGDERAIPRLLDILSNETSSQGIGWFVSRALADLHAFSNPIDLRRFLGNDKIFLPARWALCKAVGNLDQDSYRNVIEWIADDRLEQSIRWSVGCSLAYHNLDEATIKSLHQLYADDSLSLSIRAWLMLRTSASN